MAKLKTTNIKGKMLVSDLGSTYDGSSPAITLAIGDNDTGFKATSDGNTEYWSNNVAQYNMKNVYHTGRKPSAADVGAAPASHTHNYVPTSDYPLTVISKSLKVGIEWMDTGIQGSDLATGSYMVQLSGISSTASTMYEEVHTGVMSWFANATNSSDSDEVVLTKAGHASNGNHIYLRVLRFPSNVAPARCVLQICSNNAFSAASNITFKFRRLI